MSITASMVKDLREKTGVGMMDCKKALAACDGNEEKAVAWLREKGMAKAEKKAGRATSEGLVAAYITEDGKAGGLAELQCETDFVAKNKEFQAFVLNMAKAAVDSGADSVEALPEEARDVTGLIGKIGENMQPGKIGRIAVEGDGIIGSYVHSNSKLGVIVELIGAGEVEAMQTAAKDIAMQIAATSPMCVSPDQVDQTVVAKEKEIYLNQAKEEGKPEQIAEKIVIGRLNKFYKEVCLQEQPFIKDDSKTVKDLLKPLGDVRIGRFFRIAVGE
jgi:elongation factor Ts